MNTVDSVIAAALDDGQLSLSYRRYFTAEGETKNDVFGFPLANGALMLTISDKSQFSLPSGRSSPAPQPPASSAPCCSGPTASLRTPTTPSRRRIPLPR
jgi:hypothetical protein